MKEDNISQLGDYDAPFCEQQYTHGSCDISLFKFESFDLFNTPQTASNFRHLLSCGTIVYLSLFGSVTIATGQIEWSQSTNFNRIQDGTWLKSSCV